MSNVLCTHLAIRRNLGACAAPLLVAVTMAVACSDAGDASFAKRSPVPPPPRSVEVPMDLAIPVDIDDRAGTPVTRERLLSLRPDFMDSDRRVWLLTQVLGDAFTPGSVVEAVGEGSVAIAMSHPSAAEEPQPVLFLTRRGDVVVTVVLPENPFPDYHGQGGRLRRPGDLTPRISPVSRLRVRAAAR